MDNRLSCAVVRDLLPSYADGILSDETREAVDKHIEGCAECSAALKRMNGEDAAAAAPEEDVDFLRKLRRSMRRRSAIGAVMGLIILIAAAVPIFMIGRAADRSDVLCKVSVTDDMVKVTAKAASAGSRVTLISMNRAGDVVDVSVRTAPRTFFSNAAKEKTLNTDSRVETVKYGDMILWTRGRQIGSRAAAVFSKKNAYMGNISADLAAAEALGITEQLGPFTNELFSSAEPYGWVMTLKEKIPSSAEKLALENMRADACVLMSAIENLGYVEWRYQSDRGMKMFKLTAVEASKICGGNIKAFGDSAASMQKLFDTLGLKQ